MTRPARPARAARHLAAILLVGLLAPQPGHAAEGPGPAATDGTGGTPPYQPAHRGGVLIFSASTAAGTIDPHVNYESRYARLYALSFDQLLTFRKTSGPASLELVPDLAEAMPELRDGGQTYVFTLRPGIKFSDGRDVTVDDVRASLIRMFRVHAPNADAWYSVIEGGKACVSDPSGCTLPGVQVDAPTRRITIHLTHPSAEFLYQLALPFTAVLPADTQQTDLLLKLPPTTGAYMFTEYAPTRRLVLKRNPYFREWSRQAQPEGYADEIDVPFGLQPTDQVNAILRGDADTMADFVPLDRLAELGSHYAPQVHLNAMPAYYYLAMNTRMAPFTDSRVRQAVAMAVNRRVLVNIFGGPAAGEPLCQLIPPQIDGFVPYCPYSKPVGTRWVAPDLARARELIQQAGVAGQPVMLLTSDLPAESAAGIYLQSVLSDLGFAARHRSVSNNIFFTYIQNTNNRVQISLTNWYQDYPAPSNFLYVMNSCRSFHPGSDASINIPGFCDPAIDAQMDKALALGATDPAAARQIWSAVDRQLTDAAPMTTLFENHDINLVSRRLGNFVFSQIYHQLLALAWVR